MRVSTNWHLQVHFSLEQSQWGREFKTAGNNAAVYIERQHCRLKLPLEVEDSVNTVLELMLCFSANQQTCMAGIKYLWRALAAVRGLGEGVHLQSNTFRAERCHADSAASRVSANPMGSTPFRFSRAAQSWDGRGRGAHQCMPYLSGGPGSLCGVDVNNGRKFPSRTRRIPRSCGQICDFLDLSFFTSTKTCH